MTILIEDDVIRLEGRCSVEDAETLLVALQDKLRPVDASAATRIHLAVVQVLIALAPPLRAEPADQILAQAIWHKPRML